MPSMEIKIEGTGGAYKALFDHYGADAVVEMPHDVPIRVETLDQGMVGGRPSVAFIIELEQIGKVVLAQTSVRLFQMAAYATLARYGDMTEGGIMGSFTAGGTAQLILSTALECPACRRQIPGSCKYCPECGAKL